MKNSIRLHLVAILAVAIVTQSKKVSQSIQGQVARRLDSREEGYEYPFNERDYYALRDPHSSD